MASLGGRLRRPSFSIRVRIALLALVPLIAFAVIAVTTWKGLQALEAAFVTSAQQSNIARLALVLGTDVNTMQYEARRLAQTRAPDAAQVFDATATRLAKNFDELKAATASDKLASVRFSSILNLVDRTKKTFASLSKVVADLGYSRGGAYAGARGGGGEGSEDPCGCAAERIA
jgi:hypothetical protein